MDSLIKKLKSINLPFHKELDVRKYLISTNNSKDPVLRVVAWLLSFNIIPFKDIEEKVASLTKSYKDICNKELKDFNNPRSSLPKNEGELIMLDTDRTIFWFKQMANQNGINETLANNAIYSVQRILSVLSSYDSFYQYMQGYDRYVFITFLLGLQAMNKLEAELIFAEAFSFYACKELLKIVDVNKFTRNNQFTMDHFAQIDKKIASINPKIYNQLVLMHVSSVHFAMKWEILSFADEYQYPNILLIWDHIIINRNNYLKYISEMCVSHVKQISPVRGEFIVQTIQNNKKWDVNKILKDTDERMKVQSKTKWLFIIAYVLLFTIIVILQLYFYDERCRHFINKILLRLKKYPIKDISKQPDE